jgi:hypothetical protein
MLHTVPFYRRVGNQYLPGGYITPTPQGQNAGLGTYGLYFTICIAAETSLMLFGSRLLSKINIYNIFLLVCLGPCLVH